MNELIETILDGFTVDGVEIPVAYMYYHGHGEPYVVYMGVFSDNVLRGDDRLIGYAKHYDFDVYAKGNFDEIVEQLIQKLEENEFVFKPERSSVDMYEADTGYYHRTLNFRFLREESE